MINIIREKRRGKHIHLIRVFVPDRVLSSNRPGTTCGHFKILRSSDRKWGPNQRIRRIRQQWRSEDVVPRNKLSKKNAKQTMSLTSNRTIQWRMKSGWNGFAMQSRNLREEKGNRRSPLSRENSDSAKGWHTKNNDLRRSPLSREDSDLIKRLCRNDKGLQV